MHSFEQLQLILPTKGITTMALPSWTYLQFKSYSIWQQVQVTNGCTIVLALSNIEICQSVLLVNLENKPVVVFQVANQELSKNA